MPTDKFIFLSDNFREVITLDQTNTARAIFSIHSRKVSFFTILMHLYNFLIQYFTVTGIDLQIDTLTTNFVVIELRIDTLFYQICTVIASGVQTKGEEGILLGTLNALIFSRETKNL